MKTLQILIVYATTYGQTARVATYLARSFRGTGHVVTIVCVTDAPDNLSLSHYDVVIIGGSVLFGRHQRALRRFVVSHREALNATRSAFFSISGSAGSAHEASRAAACEYVAEFLKQTRWAPRLTVTIGGSVAFTKYNPLLRFIMRRIAAKQGQPTDTSRDHELTDWSIVDRFAQSALALAVGDPAHAIVTS